MPRLWSAPHGQCLPEAPTSTCTGCAGPRPRRPASTSPPGSPAQLLCWGTEGTLRRSCPMARELTPTPTVLSGLPGDHNRSGQDPPGSQQRQRTTPGSFPMATRICKCRPAFCTERWGTSTWRPSTRGVCTVPFTGEKALEPAEPHKPGLHSHPCKPKDTAVTRTIRHITSLHSSLILFSLLRPKDIFLSLYSFRVFSLLKESR